MVDLQLYIKRYEMSLKFRGQINSVKSQISDTSSFLQGLVHVTRKLMSSTSTPSMIIHPIAEFEYKYYDFCGFSS